MGSTFVSFTKFPILPMGKPSTMFRIRALTAAIVTLLLGLTPAEGDTCSVRRRLPRGAAKFKERVAQHTKRANAQSPWRRRNPNGGWEKNFPADTGAEKVWTVKTDNDFSEYVEYAEQKKELKFYSAEKAKAQTTQGGFTAGATRKPKPFGKADGKVQPGKSWAKAV